MLSFKQLAVFMFSLAGFAYSFYVVGQFILFLSLPRSLPKVYTWVFNLLDNRARLGAAYGAIVFDTLYVILFIFQHSFMKSHFVKKAMETLGLAAAERSIYCLTSALCLHYLLNNWTSAHSIILWQIDVEHSNVLWWTFSLIHAFAWMVICGGSLIMDLPELLGVKQVYYDAKGFAPPMAFKTFDVRRLYAHVRHPSFTGFLVILWATNCMSIDRFFLSGLLTAYMYLAWSTDSNDVAYQECQVKCASQALKSQ